MSKKKYREMLEKTIDRFKSDSYETFMEYSCIFCTTSREIGKCDFSKCDVCYGKYPLIYKLCKKYRSLLNLYNNRKIIIEKLEKILKNV